MSSGITKFRAVTRWVTAFSFCMKRKSVKTQGLTPTPSPSRREYKWYSALETIKPYIFKVSTPNGYGTGFQIFHPTTMPLCAIATAYHVIAHEYEWEEPIRITHYDSGKTRLLKSDNRAIFVYPKQDLAIILFNKEDLPLSIGAPKLVPSGFTLKPGLEVGWCGFPVIASNTLCFFAGYVSCYLTNEESYLVDGVAINGVSGGPAFYLRSDADDFFYRRGNISLPTKQNPRRHTSRSMLCVIG